MSREELIVGLLRLRSDGLQDVREGIKGDGGSVPIRSHDKGCRLRRDGLRCTCWLKSVDELERCMTVMQHDFRPLWLAVQQRYVLCERRPRHVEIKGGRAVIPEHVEVIGLVNRLDLNARRSGVTRVLCENWVPGVSRQDLTEGIRWLASHFNGSPQLPVEMLHA